MAASAIAKPVDVKLLQLGCAAPGALMSVVSRSNVCTIGIQKLVAQRLAARYAVGGRVRQHAQQQRHCSGAFGVRGAVFGCKVDGGAAAGFIQLLVPAVLPFVRGQKLNNILPQKK